MIIVRCGEGVALRLWVDRDCSLPRQRARGYGKLRDMSASTFETLAQFRQSLCERGEETALVAFRAGAPPRAWSCRELGARAGRFATGLLAQGFGADDRIVLCAPNSPEWVAAYFGIVACGAVAVPLDEQSGPEQLAAVLAHCRPRLVVTAHAHAERFAAALGEAGVSHCLLDVPEGDAGSWSRYSGVDEAPALPPIAADQIASLLYTSGTTGAPKAVPLTHGNFAANASALIAAGFVCADDRVLLPLPLHHTYPFTVGLLMVLGSGATVVLPASISGPEIARAASEARATALLAVPGLCAALWSSIEAGVRARGTLAARLFTILLAASIGVRRIAGLRIGRVLFPAVHARLGGQIRLIGCGGAKLAPELAWQLEGLGFQVLTGYGLTETAPVLTFNRPGKSRLGTEGQPLPGVELSIAPRSDQPHGEILARGPNVFAGYWNDSEATAAAFTRDGWFCTGDLGWLDRARFLHIEGRSKELIVLPDGKNVFPEALERLYGASPLFSEIAILEHEGELVALLVPNDEAVRAQGALRETALIREALQGIAAGLPSYQRVTDYRPTRAALPRTRLGKLKRHRLPQLYAAILAGDFEVDEKPLTDADRALLAADASRPVWAWLEQRYPSRKLTLDTSPQLDLHIDSLEWVTITLDLEREFGVRLSGEAVSRIVTLRDLLEQVAAAPHAEPQAREAGTSFRPPGRAVRALGALVHAFAWVAMRIWYRVTVRGRAQLESTASPVLLTPNHASYLDPLALAAALPWRRLRNTYWAGWTGIMFAGPLSRALSRLSQVFPVDPDRGLAAAIETAVGLLEAGHDVVWFPEGRRSLTGELEPFQPGIALLAQRAGVPIIPVALAGTFTAWPPGRRWPRPGRLEVSFGRPLACARAASARQREHRCRADRQRAHRRGCGPAASAGFALLAQARAARRFGEGARRLRRRLGGFRRPGGWRTCGRRRLS